MIITKVKLHESLTLIVLLRIPLFVRVIQAMVDKDLSESIRSKTREIGISKF